LTALQRGAYNIRARPQAGLERRASLGVEMQLQLQAKQCSALHLAVKWIRLFNRAIAK
jgi:hypothetical protein